MMIRYKYEQYNYNMKKSLFAKLGRGAAGILGLVTISACYGVPYSEYVSRVQVNGRVTDENNNPIEGIQIEGAVSGTFSGSDGSFTLSGRSNHEETVELHFQDVDGEANGGKFKDKTIEVQLKYYDDMSHGMLDTYAADDVDVKLELEK